MLKGKTASGFSYEISQDRLNNYELLEIISELKDQPYLLPKMVKMLLGDEQKQKLADHLRTPEGFVPMDAMEKEILEIFNSQIKLKNS